MRASWLALARGSWPIQPNVNTGERSAGTSSNRIAAALRACSRSLSRCFRLDRCRVRRRRRRYVLEQAVDLLEILFRQGAGGLLQLEHVQHVVVAAAGIV